MLAGNIKMKAALRKRYGGPEVFELKEVAVPEPRDNELQIKIKASAVSNSDIFIRGSKIPFPLIIPFRLMIGIIKPRKSIMGIIFSGIVSKTGKDIRRFSIGDEVFGLTGFHLGTYAEYTCIKERDSKAGCIALKPKNISFEEATSAVYGGSLALQYMDKGQIKAGQKIAIYGASGTSGTIAVQYGKYLGAHVTAICSHRNIDFVRSLGADEILDYTTIDSLDTDTSFDFVLDSVGKYRHSKLKEACKNAITENGKYVSIDDGDLKLNSDRLDQLTKLIEANRIIPVVDRVYPLEQIIEAHKYVEEGHKRGGVAVRIDP